MSQVMKYFNGQGKYSPKDTDSSSKQFESSPGIQCKLFRKAEKIQKRKIQNSQMSTSKMPSIWEEMWGM